MLDEFERIRGSLRQPNEVPIAALNGAEVRGRGTGGPSPPCPPAARFPNRSGTAPRSSSSGTMRYPTAWCAEIRPRPKRSTPPISPIGRKTFLLPARVCGVQGCPRAPLVAPLRSTSLGTRAGRSHLRANDAMDRGIGRIPRVRGAHRAVLLPRAVGGTAWISLGRRGTFTPPKPPEASSPRLTRVPRPSSHARRAANVPGLRSSSPPVVRAAPTA